jgi:hypothetical protein
MTEILIPSVVFFLWTFFSCLYVHRFKKHQLSQRSKKGSFWGNQYIFDAIAPVFPTLGILCTALGITIGIWSFNTNDIQSSIPQLLRGLRLAFIATIVGIVGLIVFQKWVAIVQKAIDEDPNRPKRQTDELSVLSELSFAVNNLKEENKKNFDRLIQSLSFDLEQRVGQKLTSLEQGMRASSATIVDELSYLRKEQFQTAEKANNNTDQIIKAMRENQVLISRKFDEFSELLSKNNTEALVEVMKHTTEQFNAQMSDLINRLVQENFRELNSSVQSMNAWQKENKEQIRSLTDNFQRTTEMFTISAATLKEVATSTQELVQDEGKLGQIVNELRRILIEDGKFQEITNKLVSTIDTLSETTESFEETTVKLNDWIRNEKNFKDAAEILIVKLEEFRDLNGNVWDGYRREMKQAVSIIRETSARLGADLENINAEFYERLNDTLNNLDQCIQRLMTPNNRG